MNRLFGAAMIAVMATAALPARAGADDLSATQVATIVLSTVEKRIIGDYYQRQYATWVASEPAGNGKGYLYVLNAGTGTMLKKITTNVGTAGDPSGLAKIAGFNAEPGGNRASYVYGGDLKGNLWRFDINSATAATIGTGSVMKFATLFSDASATLPQPIMTTPILGTILGKRVVFIGTGKYLEVSDLSDTQKQTQYAIKDDDATATLVNARTQLVQQFLISNPDGTATRLGAASATATATGVNPVDFGVNRGWFVDLPDSKERVNIDARLVQGTLIVPSIVPSSTECSPGGFGWLNFFDYRTGGAVVPQPGLASIRYDSTIVGVNVLFIAGNPVVEIVTSTNPTPTKDPNVQFQASAGVFTGKRQDRAGEGDHDGQAPNRKEDFWEHGGKFSERMTLGQCLSFPAPIVNGSSTVSTGKRMACDTIRRRFRALSGTRFGRHKSRATSAGRGACPGRFSRIKSQPVCPPFLLERFVLTNGPNRVK